MKKITKFATLLIATTTLFLVTMTIDLTAKSCEEDNNLVQTTSNYDASTLYIRTADGTPIKVTLSNKSASKIDPATSMIEGVKPGVHLLKVAHIVTLNKASRRGSSTQAKDIVSEKIIFYEKIVVPPRKVIYAFVDANGNFRIVKQRNTITVCEDMDYSLSI